MTDKSKNIFGNEIKGKALRKAEKSKRRYQKKYGDDSKAQYSVKITENACLKEPLGVYDIRVD